jgi:hypothetical protein
MRERDCLLRLDETTIAVGVAINAILWEAKQAVDL